MRGSAFVAALALTAVLLSGCSAAPEASRSVSFDAASEKAIVILGTTIDRNHAAPEDPWYRKPRSLLSHWQQYDPGAMQLVPAGARMKSLHGDGLLDATSDGDATVHVLEVMPGDYALIGAMIGRTLTLFVEPTDDIRFHYETGNDQALAGIETQGSVVRQRNFVVSVHPGQVTYIGHFDFVHAGAGQHKVTKVDYWQDVDAARAALQGYPGITAPMVSLNLALPTEEAALP